MIRYKINFTNRKIILYKKQNYFHVCNLLNKKFEGFTGLTHFNVINEDETFEKSINVNIKYLDKYLDQVLDYIDILNNKQLNNERQL